MNLFDFTWWTTERLSATANLGLLIVAIITAIFALVAVFQTKRVIQQNEEARTQHSKESLDSQRQQEEYNRIAAASAEHQANSVKLQREAVERANRPMMSARYLPPENPMSVLKLEVSNSGKSVAYRVRVEFEPDLPEPDINLLNKNSDPGQHFYYPNIKFPKSIFSMREFQTWVPGQSITTPFWVTHKDFEIGDPEELSAEGIPANQLVHITYEDERGHPYVETFELNPGIWAGKVFPETEEEKQRKALEKLAKSVEKVGTSFIQQMQLFLNRTTSPTQDEIDQRNEREAKIRRIKERNGKRLLPETQSEPASPLADQ